MLKVSLLLKNRQNLDHREIVEVDAPEQGVFPFSYFSYGRVFGDTLSKLIIKLRFTPFFIVYKSNEYKLPERT